MMTLDLMAYLMPGAWEDVLTTKLYAKITKEDYKIKMDNDNFTKEDVKIKQGCQDHKGASSFI